MKRSEAPILRNGQFVSRGTVVRYNFSMGSLISLDDDEDVTAVSPALANAAVKASS